MNQRIIKFRMWNGQEMNYKFFVNSGKDSVELNEGIEMAQSVWKLMQFTGLLDKNGKEIYEGDIVKTEDFTGYIWYRSPDFVIRQDIGSNNEHTYLDFFRKCEIIGNIFENSELLTNQD